MSDGSTSSVAVTWSATGGSVSSGGLFTAGSTAGTYEVRASQQGGSITGTAAVTVTAPPAPAPGGVVALTVARLAGGSGATLVSSGVPLAPGALRADQLGQVQVWAGGQQQAVYVEALQGRHADGSVRVLLVQFRPALTQGAPVAGELRLGVGRTTSDLAKTPVSWDVPEGVALPSDPAYLVQTDLVGPTVTAAQAPTRPAF